MSSDSRGEIQPIRTTLDYGSDGFVHSVVLWDTSQNLGKEKDPEYIEVFLSLIVRL